MICAIDLGSNSFRVVLYDCFTNTINGEYHEIVGMADGLNDTSLISVEAQNRVIKAIRTSIEKLNYNPKLAICVTTAAMRLAKNSKEVLQNFKNSTSLDFNIIDSCEEARLTLLAVKYALKRESYKTKKFIVLDIGGGSTELTICDDDKHISHSFNLGIVTLTQKYLTPEKLTQYLELKKNDIKKFLLKHNIKTSSYSFISTAGTPTTIATIKLGSDCFSYDKNLINGSIVNVEDLEKCLDIFKFSSKETIKNLVGSKRVEFVEIGTYIYKIFFEVLEKKESIVFDDGLREGVAINECLKTHQTISGN